MRFCLEVDIVVFKQSANLRKTCTDSAEKQLEESAREISQVEAPPPRWMEQSRM